MEAVGIRLNQRKPHMTYVAKQTGGVKFTATCRLTKTSEATIRSILQQYRIHNCEVRASPRSPPLARRTD